MEGPGLWVVTPGVPPVVFITLSFVKAHGQTCVLWVKPEVGICIWGEESLRTVSGAVENCRESTYSRNSSPERSLLGSERCEGSSLSGLSPFVLELWSAGQATLNRKANPTCTH